MVRNAGGRVFDSIRTLTALQTIGSPGTIAVMHHTGTSLSSQTFYSELIYYRLWYDPLP